MEYTRINFENTPSKNTPLNADNLNKMDKACEDAANEINEVNSGLQQQGLDNKYDGVQQGYYSTSDGTHKSSNSYVCSKEPKSINAGEPFELSVEKFVSEELIVLFMNGSSVVKVDRLSNTKTISAVCPSGATSVLYTIQKPTNWGTITPETVGDVFVYINSKIAKVNNDLHDLSFGDSAGGKNIFSTSAVSGTTSASVKTSIPAGTYTISAKVTSSDTDGTASAVYFNDASGNEITHTALSRNSRDSKTITLDRDTVDISFYAGVNWSLSRNDTFTFTEIQIEKGSSATDYEPYIMSNKQLTKVNASLDEQGLLNKFDGKLFQGFFDTNGTERHPTSNSTYVTNLNPVKAKFNDLLTINYKGKSLTTAFIQYYKENGTNNGAVVIDLNNGGETIVTVPADTATAHVNLSNSNGISISDVEFLGIYVNNEIDEVKAALSYDIGSQTDVVEMLKLVGRKALSANTMISFRGSLSGYNQIVGIAMNVGGVVIGLFTGVNGGKRFNYINDGNMNLNDL